jgi:pimeloyl-ACP methyl ester carboxylesterase
MHGRSNGAADLTVAGDGCGDRLEPDPRPRGADTSALVKHRAKSGVVSFDRVGRMNHTRQVLAYHQYQLGYEIYGSGDRVLVWLHGLLLDANLGRGVARTLAAQGNQVVLLDLLGHGRSDKPRHAAAHRMDIHVEQVICLLDRLGVDQVVLGGVSLGANVSLLTAVSAPERVRGLILDMPVLEWAVPTATAVFLPLLLGLRHAGAAARLVSWAASRLPQTGLGPLDSFVHAAACDPDELAAVLHGILLGPIAPTVEQRRSVTAPALVMGHRRGLLHPFGDAENLAKQLAHARLVEADNVAELWLRPGRLTAELSAFLDHTWADAGPDAPLSVAMSGAFPSQDAGRHRPGS